MKTKVLQLEWWMTSPATLEECVDTLIPLLEKMRLDDE